MPDKRRHYIVDTNAVVPFLIPAADKDGRRARAGMLKLLKMREERRIHLCIPNFCMAECSKVLAQIIFGKSKSRGKAADEYRAIIETLVEIVSRKQQGLIQSIGLTRKHLVGMEDIFLAERDIPDRKRKRALSGFDALIISMGKHIRRHYGDDSCRIVTGDAGIISVCNENQHFLPRAIDIFKDPIPDS